MEIEKKIINVEQLSLESGVDLSQFEFNYHLRTMEFTGLVEPDLTIVINAIRTHVPIFPVRVRIEERIEKKIDKIMENLGIQ